MSLAHWTVFSNVSFSLSASCRKSYNEPFTAYSTDKKQHNTENGHYATVTATMLQYPLDYTMNTITLLLL